MDCCQLDALAKLFEESTIPMWIREYVIDNEDAMNRSLDAGETVVMNGPSGEIVRIIPRGR